MKTTPLLIAAVLTVLGCSGASPEPASSNLPDTAGKYTAVPATTPEAQALQEKYQQQGEAIQARKRAAHAALTNGGGQH